MAPTTALKESNTSVSPEQVGNSQLPRLQGSYWETCVGPNAFWA